MLLPSRCLDSLKQHQTIPEVVTECAVQGLLTICALLQGLLQDLHDLQVQAQLHWSLATWSRFELPAQTLAARSTNVGRHKLFEQSMVQFTS